MCVCVCVCACVCVESLAALWAHETVSGVTMRSSPTCDIKHSFTSITLLVNNHATNWAEFMQLHISCGPGGTSSAHTIIC